MKVPSRAGFRRLRIAVSILAAAVVAGLMALLLLAPPWLVFACAVLAALLWTQWLEHHAPGTAGRGGAAGETRGKRQ